MYKDEPVRHSSKVHAQYGSLMTFALVMVVLSLLLFEPMAIYLNPVVTFYLLGTISLACAASVGFGYVRYVRRLRYR